MPAHTDTLFPAQELVDMIKRLVYKEGWVFEYLQPNLFRIMIKCEDSTGVYKSREVRPIDYDFGTTRGSTRLSFESDRPFVVSHTFIMPPEAAMFSEKDSRRWLLDRIVNVETHEACEFFALESKTHPRSYFKPFFPHTGNFQTERPYAIVDRTPE